MEKVLVMKHEFDGAKWNTQIPEEKFMQFIKDNTHEDAEVLVIDNMKEDGEKVSFEFISAKELHESAINGLIYSGDAATREEAEEIIKQDARK